MLSELAEVQLSPRAWGWTGGHAAFSWHDVVVPTRVGVDREASASTVSGLRCPHARGGGPLHPMMRQKGYPLSPRAWGWTVNCS